MNPCASPKHCLELDTDRFYALLRAGAQERADCLTFPKLFGSGENCILSNASRQSDADQLWR